jgi:hypothetical protein
MLRQRQEISREGETMKRQAEKTVDADEKEMREKNRSGYPNEI